MNCLICQYIIQFVRWVFGQVCLPWNELNGLYLYISTKDCFAIAEKEIANGNHFDAVILHGLAQGIQGFNRWAIDSYQSGNNRSYYRMTEPKNVVPRLIACMAKKLYKEYKPFDEEEVAFTKVKGSQWGIRVVVDGVEIKY